MTSQDIRRSMLDITNICIYGELIYSDPSSIGYSRSKETRMISTYQELIQVY